MEALWQEIRFAIRMLLKKPVFSAVAILTMALGIGVNAAIFSLIDAVLFRPLPVQHPEQLVRIFSSEPNGQNVSNSSYPVFTDYRDRAKSFTGISAYSNLNSIDLLVEGQKPERVNSGLVSGNFFELLGLQPAVGRLFTSNDDRVAGNHPLIVLSHRFWEKRFANNPAAVGSTVRVNGEPYTIIGVTRPDFFGVGLHSLPDLWIPITMLDKIQPEFALLFGVPNPRSLTDRHTSWIDMIGRLKPGVTMQQAQAELRTIAAVRAAGQPNDEKDPSATLITARDAATRLDLRAEATTISWVLLSVVLLVLLISCAVTAGLFLVRAEQRHSEIVVRLAMGAPRRRIVRQLLIESILVSLFASCAGLLLAQWTTDVLIATSPEEFPIPLSSATSLIDLRVLFFLIGISLISGVLFGLAPAYHASRFALMDSLKKTVSRLSGANGRLQSGFVIAQVALSVILLAGAGLMLRTLWRANAVTPGFSADHALVASLDVAKEGYTPETGFQLYEQLLVQIKALPGVQKVALALTVPVQRGGMRTSIGTEGYSEKTAFDSDVDMNIVSPRYFNTLGIKLLRGRDFQESDSAKAPMVVAVNHAMAEKFWPGKDPIGKVLLQFGPGGRDAQVVGVVENVQYRSLRVPAAPTVYVAFAQFYAPRMTLLIRTNGDPLSVLPAVTATVGQLNDHLPLFEVSTLQEMLKISLARERMIAGLLSAFGVLALLLAAIGLYTVVAYTTELRTREFGLRLALGAMRRDVLALVLSRGLGLTVAGLLIGVAGAAAATRLLRGLLFGVSPTDPVTFGAILCVMAAISLFASCIPAWHATKVNPMDALRYE